jgi:hypothetical protein
MGCPPQPTDHIEIDNENLPGSDINTAPVQPGQTVFCAPVVLPISLEAFEIQSVMSFGTDETIIGVRLLATGEYQYLADPSSDPDTNWVSINSGTNWINDGGTTAALYEARLRLQAIPDEAMTFIGWTGINEWQSCNQTLSMTTFDGRPALSSQNFDALVDIREIATPANTVTGRIIVSSSNEV